MQAPAPPDPPTPPEQIAKSARSERSRDPGEIVLIGSSVRAAAESAHLAGRTPWAVDQFGDTETRSASAGWLPLGPLKSAAERGSLRSRLDAHVGARTAVTIAGGLSGGWDWLAELPSDRFVGASPALFRQTACPLFLAELAAAAHVEFPITLNATEGRDGWLLKRRQSSGGLGITLCRSSRDHQALQESRVGDAGQEQQVSEVDLQQRVAGKPHGAAFVSDGRSARLVGVCRSLRKRLGPHPFVYAGSIGPVPVEPGVEKKLSALGRVLVERTGLRGPFNVDVMLDRGRVTLLEVNPRYSGSMELIERGRRDQNRFPCSLLDAPERWFASDDRSKMQPPAFVKRVLFARASVEIGPQTRGLPQLPIGVHWTDTPNATQQIPRQHPVATIIGRRDRISLTELFRIRLSTEQQPSSATARRAILHDGPS